MSLLILKICCIEISVQFPPLSKGHGTLCLNQWTSLGSDVCIIAVWLSVIQPCPFYHCSDMTQQTNGHLMSILSESVRTTVDLESRISQCIARFDPPTPRSSGQPPQPPGGGASASVVHSPREPRSRPLPGLLWQHIVITRDCCFCFVFANKNLFCSVIAVLCNLICQQMRGNGSHFVLKQTKHYFVILLYIGLYRCIQGFS